MKLNDAVAFLYALKRRPFRLEELDAICRKPRRDFKKLLEFFIALRVTDRDKSDANQTVALIGRMQKRLYGVSFVLGVLSGAALVSYSGEAPVNVVYFLLLVAVFPIVASFYSWWRLWRGVRNSEHLLLYRIASVWFRTVLGKEDATLPSSIVYPLLFRAAQIASAFFSIGVFVALVFLVATQDIAFGWSTTLAVATEDFARVIHALAFWWRSWLPHAVPSDALIEHSRFFRIDRGVSMGRYAQEVGEWWKFLAVTTLFYGVGLRLLNALGASWYMRRKIVETLHKTEPVAALRRCIRSHNEGFMAFDGKNKRNVSALTETKVPNTTATAVSLESIEIHIALDIDIDMLRSYRNDLARVKIFTRFDAQTQTQLFARKRIAIWVAGWEPPILESIDFIAVLADVAQKVWVVPVTLGQEDETSALQRGVWVDALKKVTGVEVAV